MSSAVTSGDSETDLMFGISSYGTSATTVAVYFCDDGTGSAYKCDQGYIHFNSNDIVTPGVACHEAGHGVGLTHGEHADPNVANNTGSLYCMQQPHEEIGANEGLGDHNEAWINYVYPN